MIDGKHDFCELHAQLKSFYNQKLIPSFCHSFAGNSRCKAMLCCGRRKVSKEQIAKNHVSIWPHDTHNTQQQQQQALVISIVVHLCA